MQSDRQIKKLHKKFYSFVKAEGKNKGSTMLQNKFLVLNDFEKQNFGVSGF